MKKPAKTITVDHPLDAVLTLSFASLCLCGEHLNPLDPVGLMPVVHHEIAKNAVFHRKAGRVAEGQVSLPPPPSSNRTDGFPVSGFTELSRSKAFTGSTIRRLQ